MPAPRMPLDPEGQWNPLRPARGPSQGPIADMPKSLPKPWPKRVETNTRVGLKNESHHQSDDRRRKENEDLLHRMPGVAHFTTRAFSVLSCTWDRTNARISNSCIFPSCGVAIIRVKTTEATWFLNNFPGNFYSNSILRAALFSVACSGFFRDFRVKWGLGLRAGGRRGIFLLRKPVIFSSAGVS
jgi:hypothetical protein